MSSLFRQNAEIARENPSSPKRRFLTRPTLTRGKGVYLKREKGGGTGVSLRAHLTVPPQLLLTTEHLIRDQSERVLNWF